MVSCFSFIYYLYQHFSFMDSLDTTQGIIPGGGGALGVEKGTDCGLTAGERWLSRPATAKKGGLSGLSLYHIVGKEGCQRQFN